MFKKLTSGLMIALGMIFMPAINIALDPALEIKAFEETQGLTLADTVEWSELNNHSLSEVFEDIILTYWYDDLNDNKLPNNVRNDIVSGIYYQRVKKYTLQSGDISTLGTSPTNFDFVGVTKKSDFIFPSTIYTPSGYVYFEGYLGETTFTDTIGKIGFIATDGSVSRWLVFVLKGIYASLAEAKTALAGKVIYYQLATPIQTDLSTYGLDTLTTEQMDYWYQKYLEYKEIDAVITPPLDVDGCDVAAGCYSYFELGRVMFYDGLLSMVPREVNDRISFPIFSNLLSFAKNGAVYLINPLLSFLSDFVPFIKVDNSDIVYTDVYHDETWVYNKGSYYETDNHSFYYYNEVLSSKKIWWYWNATESKYIGYDNVDKIYRYYYHTVTFLGSGYWTQSKLAISSEEMRKYNVTYGWKE